MTKELQVKYDNIQRDTIELFKSLCLECQKKRKRPMTKGVVVKPILRTEFSSRGQVDLIDMQSMSCRTFKWIMVYQDHLTKFCVLRPLTSKLAAEVAFQLADIFLLLGAPVILQSDNGSEFTAQIITELRSLWPELSIVHGKPRHPQSQGSVERANGDIKDMLQQETDANEPEAEADVNEPEREPPKAEMNESEQEPSHNPSIKRTLINFITASAPRK
ncbi:KRAB-A domain-containing protein 2-like [Palaemon carinicauda]|uniref:KRAB-A domain-containing protein 2-like n=1 Tax=Palaemon carinicauda TaxID=392227 RepID=UPI0035B69CE8